MFFFCSFVATVFFFSFFIYSVRVQLCSWEFRSRGRPEFQCGSEVLFPWQGAIRRFGGRKGEGSFSFFGFSILWPNEFKAGTSGEKHSFIIIIEKENTHLVGSG